MENCCSFCSTPSGQVEKIIFGPEVNICSDCIKTCLKLLEGGTIEGWEVTASPQRCGNCGRRPMEGYRHFVNRSTRSPRICERCIGLFTETLLREVPSLEEELQDIFEKAFLKQDIQEDVESEMLATMQAEIAEEMQTKSDEDQLRTLAQTEAAPVRLRSDLKPPRAVLFDLGDTLLTHLSFDPDVGTTGVLEIADNPKGYTVKNIHDRLKELNKDLLPRRETAMVEFHPHIVQRHIYEAFNITFDRPPEDVEQVFWKAAMKWSPEPGVRDMLETLQSRKLPMGIVSNAAFCGKTLFGEVAHQGLADYFQFLMSSADYWVRKPHPLLLETAAAKLGFEPADVWYVGNSPLYDVAGALNAGMGAIWYNRAEAPCDGPDPHEEVRSWAQFLDLVRKHL